MTNDVAQDDITYRQEAEIVHEKAKKEAIDKMSKILAETTEKETLKKLEKLCDSLIYQVGVLLNPICGKVQRESSDSISKK